MVCGKEFKGTASAQNCSGACRTAMSRMLAIGKKPEFWILAKSKGQKVPLFFAGKTEKPVVMKSEAPNINYQKSTAESYDGKRLGKEVFDELPLVAVLKPVSPEQRQEIEKEILKIQREECPTNTHPKMFRLQKEVRISELQEKLNPQIQ